MSKTYRSNVVLMACATALTICTTPVDAGALTKTLSRELAGRIAARQAIVGSERQAYKRILLELDTRTLKALESRFGSHIPREVLAAARRKQSTFLERGAYDTWLRKAYPNASREELRGVVGDTHPLTGSVTVNRNQVTLARTLAHERVHQLAHPRFRQRLGGEFDEGATDYFAARVSNDMRLRDAAVGYPAERELAGILTARVGEAPVARAYFRGEFDDLARKLESELGPRGFVILEGHLRRQEFGAARALLLGKKP